MFKDVFCFDWNCNGKKDFSDILTEDELFEDLFEEESLRGKQNLFDDFDNFDDFDLDNDDDNVFDSFSEDFSSFDSPIKNTEGRVINVNVSLELANAKGSKKEQSGFWKYYVGEIFPVWNGVLALCENFPELNELYFNNDSVSVSTIIKEVYSYDSKKAIDYLLWIWNTFPSSEIKKTNEAGFEFNEDIRTKSLFFLFDSYDNDYIYEKFKTDDSFIKAYFDADWEKHDMFYLSSIFCFFINKHDYDLAFKAYKYFLENKREHYSVRDICEFFDHVICISEIDNEKLYNLIKAELNRFLPHSKNALISLDEYYEIFG